jgi:all-trans-retinol 13,14-reductase
MLGGVGCAAGILGEPLLAAARAGTVYGDPDLLPERTPGWDPREVCRGGARRTAVPRPFRLPSPGPS